MSEKYKAELHKFKPIIFEARFDRSDDEIMKLMFKIIGKREAINSVHVLPVWAESIQEKITGHLLIKSIHGTLAIEGNQASEDEIKETLSEPPFIKVKSFNIIIFFIGKFL